MASANKPITVPSTYIPKAAEPFCNLVRMPRQRAKQIRTRIGYMDADQLERFMRAAKEYGTREHAMFLFAVAHGARASEICNLRIVDLNFKTEQVHIARLKGSLDSTQTLLRVKGSGLFNEPAALKAWLVVRKPDADDFVFNSQKATRLSRITVYKLFRTIAHAAGLPETLQHPHVLRSFDSTLAYVNPSDSDASAAAAKAFSVAF